MADLSVIIPEGNGLTVGEIGLPDLLPSSIANDKIMRALALAKEREMRRFLAILPSVLLWSAIDRLEEPILTSQNLTPICFPPLEKNKSGTSQGCNLIYG